MDRANKQQTIILAIFIVLATIYFIPKATLIQILPATMVKYRIIGPLLTLTLASIFMAPWQIALAMGFSLVGDFMGAYGSFIGQMGFFALAHVMLISYFVCRLMSMQNNGKLWLKTIPTAIIVLALLTFALTYIIPNAPAGIIRTGCVVYAILICSMFGLATLQKKVLFSIGAGLFLFSDMILSWNKFTSPVENSRWWIMIPYYGGQLLLWIQAAKLKVTR